MHPAWIIIALFSLPARAEEDPCAALAPPATCADGPVGEEAITALSSKFSVSCQKIREASLAAQKSKCPKVTRKPMMECAESWMKATQTIRGQWAALNSERNQLDKALAGLEGPATCAESLEQNKALLAALRQQYEPLISSAKAMTDEAKAMTDRFQKAYGLQLLKTPNTDPKKKYLSFKDEPGRAPPSAHDLIANGSVERVTTYRLALEVNYIGEKDTVIKAGGEEIKVTAAFARDLRMEGTGVLQDGRMLNSSGGQFIFVPIVRAPYGHGSYKRAALEPFRSIAVDPKVIPLGSLVYIHEARGMPLPLGGLGIKEYHDGYFRAVDVGSHILGSHIDVFSGHDLADYRRVRNWFSKDVHYFLVREK